ncbi:MAG: T9SS type A sorting domain-containing protein [Candidatus Kapaibacteriota bacterium]
MKTLLTILLVAICFFSGMQNLNSQVMNSKDLAIPIKAEVSKLPAPSIKLSWENYGYAKTYSIFRKSKKDAFWGNPVVTLDSSAKDWTDFNVKVGTPYEYQILGTGQKWVKPSDKDSGYVMFSSTGYILAGMEVMPEFSPGSCLLLIDSTMKDEIANDLTVFEEDLKAEGWTTIRKIAPRAETFDGAKVKAVKNLINEVATNYPDLKTIILIGRVPVPYSGNLNPDGHPDHLGAWPADIYYGTANESIWTDNQINSTTATREENKNVPGDGKFDVTQISNLVSVNFSVGRIDFYGMELFYDKSKANPEAELIRKYLRRDHQFRTNQLDFEWKGLIDDNFSAQSYPEGFAASAWRAFGNFFEPDSIKIVDYLTTLSTNNYLWSYGCGGGSYTSAGGIGNSSDFVGKKVNGIFTALFGSYFGDWDIKNNFLRAPLASDPGALTIGWSGRPHWFYHRMNLGETIGSALLLTQNNLSTYYPNIYYTSQYPNGILYTTGTRYVHIALLGDPTLKMYNAKVGAPNNLVLTELPNGHIKLTWEKPAGNGDYRYIIYRAIKNNPNMVLITSTPTADLQFEDNYLYDGTLVYYVEALELQTSRSGSFYLQSLPISAEIKTTGIEEISNSFVIYPNPATEKINIDFEAKANETVFEIINMNGEIVNKLNFETFPNSSNHITINLVDGKGIKFPTGVYIVKLISGSNTMIKKVIVY